MSEPLLPVALFVSDALGDLTDELHLHLGRQPEDYEVGAFLSQLLALHLARSTAGADGARAIAFGLGKAAGDMAVKLQAVPAARVQP